MIVFGLFDEVFTNVRMSNNSLLKTKYFLDTLIIIIPVGLDLIKLAKAV